MRWLTVEKDYLKYLRNFEKRIPLSEYGSDKFKPFFGELFTVGDLVYITQVSHPKKRHYTMKDDRDFIKLYDKMKLIAVVNLNYMFPVHKGKLINVEYKNISAFRTFKDEFDKGNYISLLKKEIREIKAKNIAQQAKDLYELRYNYPDDAVSQRCIDFKELEKKCLEYELQGKDKDIENQIIKSEVDKPSI
jgi:hypothetical protein